MDTVTSHVLILMSYLFQTLKDEGFPDPPLSVIAGLANDYADYVTTYEEYQVGENSPELKTQTQRYLEF